MTYTLVIGDTGNPQAFSDGLNKLNGMLSGFECCGTTLVALVATTTPPMSQVPKVVDVRTNP